MDLCEFEAIRVYRASSRTAKAMQKNSVLKKTKQRTNKRKQERARESERSFKFSALTLLGSQFRKNKNDNPSLCSPGCPWTCYSSFFSLSSKGLEVYTTILSMDFNFKCVYTSVFVYIYKVLVRHWKLELFPYENGLLLLKLPKNITKDLPTGTQGMRRLKHWLGVARSLE